MNPIARVGNWMRSIRQDLSYVRQGVADAKILSAKLLIQARAGETFQDLTETEFKVFSQFGEDGIIQYLIRKAAIPRDCQYFVELGVQDYSEANTRFLLINDNWRGLVMDAANMSAVRASGLYARHELTARSAFIDRDNINGLIADAGFGGSIGLLSIDIDGNDYWVWERISIVDPIIVIVEYNGVFGSTRAVTVPYDPAFKRSVAHSSGLYWGCSLRALELLARRKGYALVGSNRAGNNAFFVKRDHLNGQPELTAAQAYYEPRFRESQDRTGVRTFLSGTARLKAIVDMPLFDVERNETVKVGDLLE